MVRERMDKRWARDLERVKSKYIRKSLRKLGDDPFGFEREMSEALWNNAADDARPVAPGPA